MPRTLRLLLALLLLSCLALPLAGCGDEGDDCQDTSDCGLGLNCRGGRCKD